MWKVWITQLKIVDSAQFSTDLPVGKAKLVIFLTIRAFVCQVFFCYKNLEKLAEFFSKVCAKQSLKKT